MHGIAAAKRRFSKELHANLKESTIRTRKTKYLAEISHKKRSGEVDIDVTRGLACNNNNNNSNNTMGARGS